MNALEKLRRVNTRKRCMIKDAHGEAIKLMYSL